MIGKSLEQIDATDIAALITNRRPEGRQLDYKRDLPSKNDKDSREFLADITSLANTDGGDIVFGVRDVAGVAAEVYGLSSLDLEAEILRLEDLARQCVDPRLTHLRFHDVPLTDGRSVLVVRIGASLIAPHRVAHGSTSKFYGRNSRGKFEMDTGELRLAFAASESMPRKMRDLHAAAIGALPGIDMPCMMIGRPALVLTIAPLSILREARDLPVTRETAVLPPVVGQGYEMAVGLDGVVAFTPVNTEINATSAWAVNHRSGYVDLAWTIGHTSHDQPLIWPKYFDERVQGSLRAVLSRLRAYGIEGPWVAMATVVGAKGHRLVFGDGHMTDAAWQDLAYLGEVIDEDLEIPSLSPLWAAFLRLFGVEQALPWKDHSKA